MAFQRICKVVVSKEVPYFTGPSLWTYQQKLNIARKYIFYVRFGQNKYYDVLSLVAMLLKVYVNARKIGESGTRRSVGGGTTNHPNLIVGAGTLDDLKNDRFHIELDDLAYWEEILTEEEIVFVMNKGNFYTCVYFSSYEPNRRGCTKETRKQVFSCLRRPRGGGGYFNRRMTGVCHLMSEIAP